MQVNPNLFPVGYKAAGLEIVEVLNPFVIIANKGKYKVRYACCGREADMSHHTLTARIRNQARFCKKCCQIGAIRKKGVPQLDLHTFRPGVFDLRGIFWPTLTGWSKSYD